MLDVVDTHSLALTFHLNSEPLRDPTFAEEPSEVRFREMAGGGEDVALPPVEGAGGLLELIRSRSSCRRYSSRPLALSALAELIAGAYGPTRVVAFEGVERTTRSVPSAGALYPLELYLVAKDVESVPDGLYHYDIPGHSLEPVPPGSDEAAFHRALLGAPSLENANLLLLITTVFDRTLRKYGARGYRFLLLEAGHVAQNLSLLAHERGLGALCVGGFVDAAVNRYLGLDPRVEAAVYGVAVGHPA